jgi:hypothetical protein
MSELELLKAKLAKQEALLALAEEVILGYKSGLIRVEKKVDGVWGREKDRSGVREMQMMIGMKQKKEKGGEDGEDLARSEAIESWGKLTWIKVSSVGPYPFSLAKAPTEH